MKSILTLALLLCCLASKAQNIDTLIAKSTSLAQALRESKQPEKALKLLRPVRYNKLFSKASCVSKSNLYHKIGGCHYDLNDYKTALAYWQDTTLQMRLDCLGKNNKETANSYYAVAMAYRYLEDRGSEGENVRRGIEILEALPENDPADLAYKYLEAGSLFADLKDYGQALFYYEEAQRIYNSIPKPDETEVAELRMQQGLAKAEHGMAKDGAKDILSALAKFKKMGEKEYAQNIAYCYQNLSIAHREMSEFAEAEKYARMALRINQQLKNDYEISNNYEAIGTMKKKLGKYPQALNFYQKSLAIRKKEKDRTRIAYAYENIGDVYMEKGDLAKALENYQASVVQLLPDNKKGSGVPILAGQAIVDRPSLLRVLGLQAKAYRQLFEKNKDPKDLRKAYQLYQTYDILHIQIRQRFKKTDSKYWLMKVATPVYEAAIGTALQLHQLTKERRYLEEAYLFSAKSKAAVLLEGLQELDARMNGVSVAVLKSEKSAREEYTQLEKEFFQAMQSKDGKKKLDSLEALMFQARRTYDKMIERLEAENPAYYQLKYAFPNATSLAALQSDLPTDAVILEYFIGEKTVYIFKISKANIQCFEAEKPTDFDNNCLVFRKMADGTTPLTAEEYARNANALFETLLEKPLQGLDATIKRLIVIPDNVLLQLPFDVLPSQPVQVGGTARPYLLKKYAITIAYSNQLLFGKNTPPTAGQGSETFGGFGLEYDDFTLKGLELLNSTDSLLKKRFAGRLPNSDDEVEDIAKLLKGDTWLNRRATKAAFLANAFRYKILHLAMHGIIDEKNPLNSALVFTREDGLGDFILRASEIYDLRLNAEMAVLSACNTGNGEVTPEGVRSLARAFTFAGCPSLVASLWNAYDAQTREILVSFYQHLKEGHPKDVALQLAKLEYLGKQSPTYAFPEYWSNLVVIGDPSPLVFEEKEPIVLIFVLGIAILGLFFFLATKFWRK